MEKGHLPTQIRGQYVASNLLAQWSQNMLPGDVPAVQVEFEFPTIIGEPQRRKMWSLLDTGADVCAFPAFALGFEIPVMPVEDGNREVLPSIRYVENSIGSQLAYRTGVITGINGSTFAFYVRARLRFGDEPDPAEYWIALCGGLAYPVVGRQIINQKVGIFNPFASRVRLSSGRFLKTIGSFTT